MRFWVASQQDQHFTNALYQFRATFGDDLGGECSAVIPVANIDFYLDQFMVIQCAFQLLQQAFSQSLVSDYNDRIKIMRNGAVLLFFGGTQTHDDVCLSLRKTGAYSTNRLPQ